MIYDALRAPSAKLSADELRKVTTIVAFTPEEFEVHGPEIQSAK
jgi:hypothetical protein